MRIITDIDQPVIDALKWMCEEYKISRAEAIRRAVMDRVEKEVAAKKQANKEKILAETFGAWKHLGIDTMEYLDEIRGPDREWSSEKGEWIYKE